MHPRSAYYVVEVIKEFHFCLANPDQLPIAIFLPKCLYHHTECSQAFRLRCSREHTYHSENIVDHLPQGNHVYFAACVIVWPRNDTLAVAFFPLTRKSSPVSTASVLFVPLQKLEDHL